ncbi:MAG: hypothetical protein R3C56_08800 [Pirellulaceae bacterium]
MLFDSLHTIITSGGRSAAGEYVRDPLGSEAEDQPRDRIWMEGKHGLAWDDASHRIDVSSGHKIP